MCVRELVCVRDDVFVCVNVSERDRDGEKERKREGEKEEDNEGEKEGECE